MRIKFVLSMLFIAATLVAAIWQKVIPLLAATQPSVSVFTVQRKDGRTIEVTEAKYAPTFEKFYMLKTVSLDTDTGWFRVNKDLQNIQRVEVLNKDGTQLRITFQDGDVLEGKREYTPEPGEKPWNPHDYIRGKSGKLDVSISFEDIVSITRKEVGNER